MVVGWATKRYYNAYILIRLDMRTIITSLVLVLCSTATVYAQAGPEDSNSLTRLAIMKIRGGHYEEAIGLLNKAINMDDKNVLAYFQRGCAKAGLSDYED